MWRSDDFLCYKTSLVVLGILYEVSRWIILFSVIAAASGAAGFALHWALGD